MTNEERLKSSSTTQEFAKLLFEFSSGFYSERISGLCNIRCEESKNSCPWCIENWLKLEENKN